jgi:DNA polymerase-3 subunit beta
MKLRVPKERILEGFQTVQSVISSRTTLPVLQNVLLETGPNTLSLSATDLDVAVSCVIEAEVSVQGSTTIPAKKAFSILREMPSGDIELELDPKNNNTILRSGGVVFKLLGLPKDDFPPMTTIENAKEHKIGSSLLRDMLRKTSYAISGDETRYVLNGIFLSFKDMKLTMVATDGRRLALTDTELEFPKSSEVDIILPTKAVNELQRILEDDGTVTVAIADTRISFQVGRTLLISKLTDGKYPNYRQVIPNEARERITMERDLLLTTLKRTALVASDKNGSLKMAFDKDTVTVSASSTEFGEAQESMPIKYRGKEMTLSFNPSYLLEPLRALNNDAVHLDLVDDMSPAVLRVDNSSFLCVVMPMRAS